MTGERSRGCFGLSDAPDLKGTKKGGVSERRGRSRGCVCLRLERNVPLHDSRGSLGTQPPDFTTLDCPSWKELPFLVPPPSRPSQLHELSPPPPSFRKSCPRRPLNSSVAARARQGEANTSWQRMLSPGVEGFDGLGISATCGLIACMLPPFWEDSRMEGSFGVLPVLGR